ncbi:hypothetical protein HDE_00920 [Halotydeus destructor]|nr:hypothetical protein HDE_00920 [Halotydeus destructor]
MTFYIVVICIFILLYFYILKQHCHLKQHGGASKHFDEDSENIGEVYKHDLLEDIDSLPKAHINTGDAQRSSSLDDVIQQQQRRSSDTGSETIEQTHLLQQRNSKSSHTETTVPDSTDGFDPVILSSQPKIDLSRDSTMFTIPAKPYALPRLSTMNFVPVFTTQSFFNRRSHFALETEPAERGFYNFNSVGAGDLGEPGDAILIAANSLYEDETLVQIGPASAIVQEVASTYVEKDVSFWKFPHHSYVQSKFVFCMILDPEAQLNTFWFQSHADFFVNLDQLISYALKVDGKTSLPSNCRYFFRTKSSSIAHSSFEYFLGEVLTKPHTTKVHFSVHASNGAALPSLRQEAQQLILKHASPVKSSEEDSRRLLELLFSDILAASPLELVSRKIVDLQKIDQSNGFPTIKALNTFNLLENIDMESLADMQIIPISQYPLTF